MSKVKTTKTKTYRSKQVYPEDYRWDLAFESIRELTGAGPNALRRASRVTPLPASRMIVAYVMYRELYMTPEYISKQLNKDRTATYYYLRTMDEYKSITPYKEYYEAFRELFYKKITSLGYVCTCCGALEPAIKGDKYLKPNTNENT
jgi:hypothetical protein